MDCAAGDFGCYFDALRTKLIEWAPVLHAALGLLTDLFNAAIEVIKPHLQSLIALGSLSFAIWKWVRYRERALFRRLRDLVAQTVSGLRVGRTDLLNIVCRPSPGQSTSAPLFIEEPLRKILLRRYWWLVLRRVDPITSTDKRLDRVLREIDKQLQWTEMRLTLYRQQRATVHLVKGALASARSERASSAQGWWKTNNEALAHFRDALGVPGNNKDIGGLEYKAHQLRKLGHLDGALTAYQELEACIMTMDASKQRSILLARTVRYQVEIYRLQVPPALGTANSLLTAALQVLAPYAPLVDRELLEQAEINELHGCVRFGLNFNNAARESLSAAEADYQRLLDSLEREAHQTLRRVLHWLYSFIRDDGSDGIVKSAKAGLARVRSALQDGKCSS